MCLYVDSRHVLPGWGCCSCEKTHGMGVYNGLQRPECKQCKQPRCEVLSPDPRTKKVFADRKHYRTKEDIAWLRQMMGSLPTDSEN